MARTLAGEGERNPVLVRRDGAICIVAIDRPKVGNAIDRAVRQGITRAMLEIGSDQEIRVVLLTGSGEEAFSIGSDVAQLATLTPLEAEALSSEARRMHEAIASIPQPIVAAIKGPCIGAGLELALHADIRFARADARFGLPSVTIGLPSGGSTMSRLCHIIGSGPGIALALTGGIINAERAFMLGLISNVLSPDQFDSGVEQLTQHLSSLSPLALRETKRLFQVALKGGSAAAAEAGTEAFARCFADGEVAQRLRSFYGGPEPGAPVH